MVLATVRMALDVARERPLPPSGCDRKMLEAIDYVLWDEFLECCRFGAFLVDG